MHGLVGWPTCASVRLHRLVQDGKHRARGDHLGLGDLLASLHSGLGSRLCSRVHCAPVAVRPPAQPGRAGQLARTTACCWTWCWLSSWACAAAEGHQCQVHRRGQGRAGALLLFV